MMGHQVQSRRAVLDNYLGDFLSHNMQPIQHTVEGSAIWLHREHDRPAILRAICSRRHLGCAAKPLLHGCMDQIGWKALQVVG